MKKLLLLTAAAAIATSAVAEARTPYVAARAGYGFTKTDVKRGKMDDYIPVLGIAAGIELPNNFRTELEYGYRFESEDTVKSAKAKMTAHTLMLNGYYDFKNQSQWTPYVGLGIGMNYWDAETKLNGRKLYDKDGWGWAASAMTGISYDFNHNLAADFTIKYTYLDAADDGSHNIDGLLGLRYKF